VYWESVVLEQRRDQKAVDVPRGSSSLWGPKTRKVADPERRPLTWQKKVWGLQRETFLVVLNISH